MDAQPQDRVSALARALASRTPAERARSIDELAATEPDLAAHLKNDAPAADVETELLAAPGFLIPVGLPERFRVIRFLGRGGFGAVYEAYDKERRCTVAVKILRDPHPDTLYRFKQEFRALATLRHPHLIELYELFEHGQTWFFTMELVEGEHFVRHVRREGGCDFDRVRAVFRDLTQVLAWLHAQKLVHRDIKPDNVLIESSGRLVLLDFGLARRFSGPALSATSVVGTPAYMAPEQMSSGAAVDGSADWYAVGVMLYEAMTGRLPFTGTVPEVLAAKNHGHPVPPVSISPETPPLWNDICLRLLARQPDMRPDAMELLRLTGDDDTAARPQFVEDFFGREDVLLRMLRACDDARSGMAQVVEVEGSPGSGKSRIVQTFSDAISARDPHALVLRGRCYEHESLPFKALDAMMDDLSRHLWRMGPALESQLAPDIGALARIFPVLERVDTVASFIARNPLRIANATELRRRAFHAFAALLNVLSTQHLVVICLDDLHWGDVDSAGLFAHLFSGPQIPRFVLVAAFRSGEAASEFRSVWREHVLGDPGRFCYTHVTVGPLDAGAAAELARSLLARSGAASEEIASELAARSEGNPLLLQQLAAELVRSDTGAGVLRHVSLAELIQDRVSRLSAGTRQLLQFLAALGEPVPEEFLAHLLPTQPGQGSAVVSSLVSQHLIRRRSSRGGNQFEIQNYQIREAILQKVPEPDRQRLHLQIAGMLIEMERADPGMIAVQLARGGDNVRAAAYAEKAAEAAEAVLAFNRAAQFYSVALSLGRFDRSHTADLEEHLAVAHSSSGRGAEAAAAYLRAAENTDLPDAASSLRRRAGEQWIRSGNIREGVRVLASGAGYRVRHTDSTALAIVSLLWSRCLLAMRGLEFQERPGGQLSPKDLAKLDIDWALGTGLSLWNPVIASRYHLRYLRRALNAGEPRAAALGLAAEAAYAGVAGEVAYARARNLIGRALAIGQKLNDSRVLGAAYAADAMCGFLTGRWDLARERGEHANQILVENCAGVSWEIGLARNAWLGGLLWGGKLGPYSARLAEFSQDAQDRGDLSALATYRMNRAPLSLALDDPAQAEDDLIQSERILANAWSGRGFHVPQFFSLYGSAEIAVYKCDCSAAVRLLDGGLARLRRSFLLRVETFAMIKLIMEAKLALTGAADLAGKGSASKRLLRRARRCASEMRRMPAIWRTGVALLMDAGADAVEGRKETACVRWSDAEWELNRAGMAMYAAAARYQRGRMSGDADLLASAEQLFRTEGVRCPARAAQLFAPGVIDA